MKRPRPGDRISEYILIEQLGSGTFGEVWKARHHVWDQDLVAIKIPTDAEYVRTLQHEGVTIHGLRHPNIVRAIGLDPYASPAYLITEYVDGESLRDRIDHGPVELQQAVSIFRQIMEGLRFAHEHGVMHGDIKPANVLIASDGTVKLTDFGLGRVQDITTQSIMQSGSLVTEQGRSISGTLAYMAPEQRDGQETDQRADLYSAGIVLFEMLTGDRPAGGELPSQVRPEVPGWLDDIFSRCYTRVDRRIGAAAKVLLAIDQALGKQHLPRVRPPGARAGTSGGKGRCPSCGQASNRDDQFCIHCGQQFVSQVIRCHKCGSYPDPADKFCIRCGAALTGVVSGQS